MLFWWESIRQNVLFDEKGRCVDLNFNRLCLQNSANRKSEEHVHFKTRAFQSSGGCVHLLVETQYVK